MAHDEERRRRERMWREDETRRHGSGGGSGGPYRGENRGWSENAGWNDRGRGEWSSSSPGSGYGSRRDSSGEAERWSDRSGSDWEDTGWRDLERDRGRGYEYGAEHSRSFPGRDMGQGNMGQGGMSQNMEHGGWGRGGRDRRQQRDYGGSLRAGEYGGRSSSYGGSRYGRSGMGYGGDPDLRAGSGREYDQFAGMSAEPGFGAGYGAGAYRGGMAGGSASGAESGYGYGGPHDWSGRSPSGERGFFDRATDEVSSWFGDEDAERRREMDRRHSGRGPRNYARSDSRINEDVCDRLTEHAWIDASDIEVAVSDREVTLSGTVRSRDEKRRAEDVVEAISGVTHVQNNLRVKQHGDSSVERTLDSFSSATSGAFGERGGSTMSSRSGGTGGAGSSTSSASGASETKTTGSSPGVMRPDPSTASTKGA